MTPFSPMRLFLRLLLPLALACHAGPLRGGEPPSAAAVRAEPPIELPVFEVKDTRLLPPPESWRYAEVPGFEILSRISERETKRFVQDFLLLQEVIDVIMPGLTRGHVAVPTALILCGRGKGFDEFVPAAQTEERYGMNSLFFKNPERAAIVIDFAISELRFNTQEETVESDPYRSFYIEYFRFLIRRQMAQPPPPWFEEGLVQLFGAIDFTKKWITFAQIGDGFGAEKLGDFNHILSRRAIMPMAEMLRPEGPRARTRYWKAQCYAFVHMCLYGMNGKYQKGFIQFLTRLSTEPLTEKLFQECFKKTYKQMALELRGHVEFTVYKAMRFEAKKGQQLPEPPPAVLRDATDAEVGRIKGEVLRLGGRGEESHNTLIAPYVRGERDPRLLAALGLDELESGRADRARKFLEAATQAKVVRARAYLELARLRLGEARTTPGAPNGQLDAAQVSSVLTPLFTAMKQPPPMAEVYSLVADAWSLSAVAPQPEHLGVVIEGVKRFPRNTELLMQATMLATKRGFPAEATALAERGVKISRDPGEQDRFRMLAAAVARDTAPAPAVELTPEKSEPYLLKKP